MRRSLLSPVRADRLRQFIGNILSVGGGLGALRTVAITAGLAFAFVLLSMRCTVYLGPNREPDITASDEFAKCLNRIEAQRDALDRGNVATDIEDDGDSVAIDD
jgi:choline/glycine/proline betaine transport protein